MVARRAGAGTRKVRPCITWAPLVIRGRPRILARAVAAFALALVAGYVSSALRREPRCPDPGVVAHLRGEQRARWAPASPARVTWACDLNPCSCPAGVCATARQATPGPPAAPAAVEEVTWQDASSVGKWFLAEADPEDAIREPSRTSRPRVEQIPGGPPQRRRAAHDTTCPGRDCGGSCS